jgi:hypothetical protein
VKLSDVFAAVFLVVEVGGLQALMAALVTPAERYDWIKERPAMLFGMLPEANNWPMDWAWGWTFREYLEGGR